jgi:hypothetical protein
MSELGNNEGIPEFLKTPIVGPRRLPGLVVVQIRRAFEVVGSL